MAFAQPSAGGRAHATSNAMYRDDIGGGGGGGAGLMASMPTNYMASAGTHFLQNKLQSYIPGLTAFWESLRYYFDVHNRFVLHKLKALLVPYTHKKWGRIKADPHQNFHPGFAYVPPCGDDNAPDLYVPMMAFITYVLVTGLLKGTRLNFTPEVLGDVVTSSMVVLVLEVLMLKAAMWLLSGPSVRVLDLVAYAGYKYVGLNINTIVGLLLGSVPYYIVLLITGSAMCFFIIRTLKEVLPEDRPQMNWVCIAAGAMQLVLMWWLGYSSDL